MLKVELVTTCSWSTRCAARQAIFKWLGAFYDQQLTHSALGYQDPVDFGQVLATEVQAA